MKKYSLMIFLLSLSYMFFMTSNIPFFWDDHQFHQGYASQSSLELIKQMFDFSSESALSTARSTYALFFKFLFYSFDYNFAWFRFFKAIVFAFSMIFVHILANFLIKNKLFATISTLLIMFSFPIYIHTLVFDEPFILAELLKLIVVILFVKELYAAKSSLLRQFSILALSFLMLRAYNPSASIILTIFAYLVLNFRLIKKYFILCLFLALISFPFSILRSGSVGGPHGFNPGNLYKVFLNINFIDFFIPDLSPTNLYYKPFLSIITTFSLWLLLASIIILLINRFKHKKQIFNEELRKFLPFLIIWCLAELTLYLFLAEHAIRYISAFLIPFYILFGIIIYNTFLILNKSKTFLRILIIVFSLTILINLEYSSAFRAGWGSNFAVREKVVDFFLENNLFSNETIILYNSAEVSEMFLPLNKSNKNYELIFMDNFKRSKLEDFSQDNLNQIKLVKKNIYVLKLTTSGGKESPDLNFSQHNNLRLLIIIDGNSGDLFDKLRDFINYLGFDIPYSKFEIYQIIS